MGKREREDKYCEKNIEANEEFLIGIGGHQYPHQPPAVACFAFFLFLSSPIDR